MATKAGAPDTDPDDDGDDEVSSGKTVPYARLQRVTEQRRALKAQLAEAQAKIDELEDAATGFAKQVKQFESVQAELDGLKGERESWAAERSLVGAGMTDPEGIDLAKLAYSRLKPEDRPKGGIGEWLKGDSVPKGVRSYLPVKEEKPAAGAKPNGATSTTPQQGQRANTDAKARSTPGAPQTFAPGSVSQMSNAELAASQEAIWQSMGMQVPNIPGVSKPAPKA
jgi:hypothetical protein